MKRSIYEDSYGKSKINEEDVRTFDAATHEQLMALVQDDLVFLEKLGTVLNQILPSDRRAQVLRVLQDRNQTLRRFAVQAKQHEQKNKQQQKAANAYADADAAQTRGNVDTFA